MPVAGLSILVVVDLAAEPVLELHAVEVLAIGDGAVDEVLGGVEGVVVKDEHGCASSAARDATAGAR